MGLFDFFKNKKANKDSKQPTLDFDELQKRADEGYALIMSGKKDKVNFVETRCLVYGVDFVKWARESFNVLDKLDEDEIKILDLIMDKLRMAVSNEQLDEKTEFGYFSGILGVFGLLLSYYKNAIWIEENRDDDGYKMNISGKKVFIEKEIGAIYDGKSEFQSLDEYYKSL